MAGSNTSEKPPGITCPKYVRGEGKRCLHYLPNGGCALPDEFMCVEWLKVNGHRAPASPSSPKPLPVVPALPKFRGLTTDDIERFQRLALEVCIYSDELGDIWVVPAYTGSASRTEVTPEDLATVARVLNAFPGSRVVAFQRKNPAPPAKGETPS